MDRLALTRAASAYSIPWNQNKTGGKCRNSRDRLQPVNTHFAPEPHVYPSSNRSQSTQRPKIYRPHLCHRQGHFLHECPKNRHRRQIPRPSLREPRRPRPTHRRLLPPSPTRLPLLPIFRRRPHLLRVDPPPPPRRRNPGVALPERQQIQRPTEVPPRTVRHRQPQLLLQTPVPPRCHPPRPLACPRCPRQTQDRSRRRPHRRTPPPPRGPLPPSHPPPPHHPT